MNAPVVMAQEHTGLARLVLSAFSLAPGHGGGEADWLEALQRSRTMPLREAWLQWLSAPPVSDFGLHQLARQHGFTHVEMVAVALCCAAELDPMVPRVLHGLQTPVASSLPTLGLAARAAIELDGGSDNDITAHLTSLHGGAARRLGLIEPVGEQGVLVERSLRTPPALALALAGFESGWPEIVQPMPPAVHLGEQVEQALDGVARAMRLGQAPLVLRSAWPQDGFSAAACLAARLGLTLVHLPATPPPGVGVWLGLTGRVPVLSFDLAPGEARELAPIVGHGGPVIVLAGAEGTVNWNHAPCPQWVLPPLPAPERTRLWQMHGAPPALANDLGAQLRLTAARIQELAQAAGGLALQAGRGGAMEAGDVARAARGGAALGLGAQARLLPDEVADDALVLPPALRDSLEDLRVRCLLRDALADGLGLAVRTRYRSGVRALFTGAAGTGKTLAASWLATRLGLPLYRVDLSSVVSKYIGETEKNLAQLFARADSAEVVLLFDEADALFGKRTDIKDSNDRFANQQTNYLLQRIESFEGIAVLTSNSRGRFDAAFTRRLDMVIEFTAPTPQERLALWQAHLGEGHALDIDELNRVAALCDLAGGHIRSCTLMAASLARPIRYAGLRRAILAEYAKLGRMAPAGL